MSGTLAKFRTKARKLAKVLMHRGYRSAFLRGGVAAAIEHEPLLRTMNFATVIDIGANRGQFALVSRRCFPNARIVSFEPLPQPAARFRAVLGRDAGVSLHELAIDAQSGQATIHVSAADDSSSLLPITKLQSALFAGTEEIGTAKIRVARLDECIQPDDLQPPALLKIDVQGYELHVLQGCEPLLSRFDHLYVECSFQPLYEGQADVDDVLAYLRERGFRLQGAYNASYDFRGRAIQADLLFARGVAVSS
jgi:FkbM family methyltransferase